MAAVGAALSVMYEYHVDEKDKRIPACIADIVGDTVGVVAGMGVVLFGSFAGDTCAALVLTAFSDALDNSWIARRYPAPFSLELRWESSHSFSRTVISRERDECGAVEKALNTMLSFCIVFTTPVVVVLSWMCLPVTGDVHIRKESCANAVKRHIMFLVVSERMTKVPTALAPFTMKVKVLAPPE